MEKVALGFFIGWLSVFAIQETIPHMTSLYKQGQVDALTGKVVYVLKTNPDKTVEWVLKDEK